MELFEFRGEDITDEEDGGIIRRIITKGQGYSKPNEGAAVEGNIKRHHCSFANVFYFGIGICYWHGCNNSNSSQLSLV